MVPEGSGRPPPDLRLMGGRTRSIFLYGSSRPVVLRAAFSIASLLGSETYWLDIREPHEAPDAGGPSALGWIPDDHLFVLAEDESNPQDDLGNLALFSVIRSDEPRSTIAALTDFLRLPPRVQELLSAHGSDERPPALVIANSDRVRSSYPKDADGVRPVVNALLQGGVRPLFAAVGPPGAGRMACDVVFEARCDEPAHWDAGTLICERALEGLPVRAGDSIPLSAVPSDPHRPPKD